MSEGFLDARVKYHLGAIAANGRAVRVHEIGDLFDEHAHVVEHGASKEFVR